MPPRRKPTRTSQKKAADSWFSKVIRSRDRKCLRCGSDGHGRPGWWLQCAHVVSRRYLATRYDEGNAVTLCASCHQFFTMRPLEWDEWVIERIGQEAYDDLRRRALDGTRTLYRPDYSGIIAHLKGRLEALTD